MSAFTSQLRTEVALASRQGEQLLVSLGIPLLVLVFFSLVDVVEVADVEQAVDYVAPATLALAVMSTAMVSLGIGTGFERQYGVLKRLGASPLGTRRLVGAKTALVVLTEVSQFVVLISVAVLIGWRPPTAGWVPALAGAALGTLAFAGIGLLLAGTLPGLGTLAAANGLYLVLLLTGGMIVPLDRLPSAVAAVAGLLPAAALVEVMTGSFIAGRTVGAQAWIVLAFWAVAAPAAAIRWFRWE